MPVIKIFYWQIFCFKTLSHLSLLFSLYPAKACNDLGRGFWYYELVPAFVPATFVPAAFTPTFP